jgi:hypothetical protein
LGTVDLTIVHKIFFNKCTASYCSLFTLLL